MPNIKAILFDLDGTLIDSQQDLVNSVNFVLEKMGFEKQSYTEIISRIGNGLRQLLRDTLKIDNEAILQEAKSLFEFHYGQHCVDFTKPYAGVVSTLQELQPKAVFSVVTNKPAAFAEKILIELGLRSLFHIVIGGDSTPETKPSPVPLQRAMALLQVDPSVSLMVGDGEQDIRAALAAKVDCCLVQYGFGYRKKLLDLNPAYAIAQFDVLKEILR